MGNNQACCQGTAKAGRGRAKVAISRNQDTLQTTDSNQVVSPLSE